jgi:hypothetical protein
MSTNRQSWLRGIVFALLTSASIFTWIKYNDLVIYNDVNDVGAMNEAEKARFFEHTYPTAEQISDYLSDATIVISYNMIRLGAPGHLYENKIIYLDTDHRYYQWRASGINEFDTGSWSIRDRFMISNFHGRRKYQWVELFCLRDNRLSPQDQVDNCKIADGLGRLLSRGYEQLNEYRKGDTFSISNGVDLPFRIPNDSAASFDGFLALYHLSTK